MSAPHHDILSSPSRPGLLDELPGAHQRGDLLRLLSKLRDIVGADNHFAVCFTSALPGEGTTTIASQFACAAALTGGGDRVVLVDGNLVRPQMHDLLGLDSSPGLAEVCSQGLPLTQAVQGTELEHLDVVTAGSCADSPTFLNSTRFRETIRDLKASYDLVVIDCPPLAEGHASTHLADEDAATVLVVQASSTKRDVVIGAQHELKLMGATPIGVVLNRRRFFIPSFVYRRL